MHLTRKCNQLFVNRYCILILVIHEVEKSHILRKIIKKKSHLFFLDVSENKQANLRHYALVTFD